MEMKPGENDACLTYGQYEKKHDDERAMNRWWYSTQPYANDNGPDLGISISNA